MSIHTIFKVVILTILSKHKFNYAGIIYRKFRFIYDVVIKFSIDKLSDPFYTNNTKFYWYLNDIKDFPKCQGILKNGNPCNHIFKNKNVVITHGYPKFCSTTCSNLDTNVQLKMQEAYLNHFGYISPFKCPSCIEKRISTYITNYGVDNNMKSPKGYQEFKNGILTKNKKYCKTRYYRYNNILFDSSWELAYYIWLKDNKIQFKYQPDLNLTYIGKDKKLHTYLPDFLLLDTNTIVELKGDNAFTNGLPIRDKKYPWFEKYQCMLDNNVKILQYNDIFPILSYIKTKYGKYYLQQFILGK